MHIKIVSLRKTQGRGMLYHFSHFMRDFLIPFFDLTLTAPNITKVTLNSKKGQTVGTFQRMLEEFFDIEFESVPQAEFDQTDAYPVNLPCLATKQVPNYTYEQLITHIENKFKLKKKPPQFITMIERKQDDIQFMERNGAQRRSIVNHDEINNVLSVLPNYRSVALEGLTLKEQIRYFYHSKVIIAQHGASLCNTIFTRDATILEIVPSLTHRNARWFRHIRDYKEDLNWRQIVFPGKFNRLHVPPKKLLSLIRSV